MNGQVRAQVAVKSAGMLAEGKSIIAKVGGHAHRGRLIGGRAQEGIKGLYRGMAAPLTGVTPMYALCFFGYGSRRCPCIVATHREPGVGKKVFCDDDAFEKLKLGQIAMAGAMSAAFTTPILAPGTCCLRPAPPHAAQASASSACCRCRARIRTDPSSTGPWTWPSTCTRRAAGCRSTAASRPRSAATRACRRPRTPV